LSITQSKSTGLWLALEIIIAASLLFIYDESPEYPELENGVRVVRYMSAKRQLARSSFIALQKNKTASDFVDWIFAR
jgi:hypothetical protein